MAKHQFKTTNIKGKEYVEVNTRVKYFRESGNYNGYGIQTEFIHFDEKSCVVRASITNADGIVVSTGIAAEDRGSSYINKTSYVENCETSAVGRALGFMGIGIDTSIATANEVTQAIAQQSTPAPKEDVLAKALDYIKSSKDKEKAISLVLSKRKWTAGEKKKIESVK